MKGDIPSPISKLLSVQSLLNFFSKPIAKNFSEWLIGSTTGTFVMTKIFSHPILPPSLCCPLFFIFRTYKLLLSFEASNIYGIIMGRFTDDKQEKVVPRPWAGGPHKYGGAQLVYSVNGKRTIWWAKAIIGDEPIVDLVQVVYQRQLFFWLWKRVLPSPSSQYQQEHTSKIFSQVVHDLDTWNSLFL